MFLSGLRSLAILLVSSGCGIVVFNGVVVEAHSEKSLDASFVAIPPFA